ncbi:MAG TPA: NUDIX domain-containing protein [Gammaproteobacteria bacterium]|nr:NUDIX domain-containing protein [Gammaproteobacteria bacterium]
MKWETLGHKILYQGFFRLEQYKLRYDRFAGGSNTVTREIFERGDSVAVLPYDPVRDEIVLVEQFRPGAARHTGSPWLLELIAGMLDKAQTPEQTARREALEEARCELTELFPIYRYLVSPGGTTESTTVFVARTNTSRLGGLHGLAEEHEDIKVHVFAAGQALDLLNGGKIENAVTIIGLQWLALNRSELRRRWGCA